MSVMAIFRQLRLVVLNGGKKVGGFAASFHTPKTIGVESESAMLPSGLRTKIDT